MRLTPGTGGLSKLRSRLVDAITWPRRRSALVRRVTRAPIGWLDRLDSPLRRGVAAGVLLALAAGLGVVVNSGFGAATADDAVRAGRQVPASLVQPVAAAALSCPVLTPARLAGQLMAASGFNPDAHTDGGGRGVAGLTEAVWTSWKPGPTARRSDPAANIVALARHMCDLSGQVRQAGVDGDRWRLALAAYHSGLADVREAAGVPGSADGYVRTVAGYAAWYASRPEFTRTDPTPSPAPLGGVAPSPGTSAKPVPAEYLKAILAAGRTCPAVSPARIAAHLMAVSAFNPNLLGSTGAQGIAQFDPAIWARYAPDSATTSPWDPQLAIAAFAVVMCTLQEEVGQVGQGDTYQAALVAYQWGPDAVRRSGGLPASPAVRRFLTLTRDYTTAYERDPRLGGTPARPDSGGTRPTASGSKDAPAGRPTPTTTRPAAPPSNPPQTTSPPAGSEPKAVGAAGPIIGFGSDRCIDVTDGAYQSNPQLQIWTCDGGPNQRWTFYSDGTVRAFGRCMTVAGGSTADGAKILLSTCSGSEAQVFTLNRAHDLVNRRADKCVDVTDNATSSGSRLQLWSCGGTANQKWRR